MTARCTSTTTCQGQVARRCSLALTVLGTSLQQGMACNPLTAAAGPALLSRTVREKRGGRQAGKERDPVFVGAVC